LCKVSKDKDIAATLKARLSIRSNCQTRRSPPPSGIQSRSKTSSRRPPRETRRPSVFCGPAVALQHDSQGGASGPPSAVPQACDNEPTQRTLPFVAYASDALFTLQHNDFSNTKSNAVVFNVSITIYSSPNVPSILRVLEDDGRPAPSARTARTRRESPAVERNVSLCCHKGHRGTSSLRWPSPFFERNNDETKTDAHLLSDVRSKAGHRTLIRDHKASNPLRPTKGSVA
jgi:hypothetical protein